MLEFAFGAVALVIALLMHHDDLRATWGIPYSYASGGAQTVWAAPIGFDYWHGTAYFLAVGAILAALGALLRGWAAMLIRLLGVMLLIGAALSAAAWSIAWLLNLEFELLYASMGWSSLIISVAIFVHVVDKRPLWATAETSIVIRPRPRGEQAAEHAPAETKPG